MPTKKKHEEFCTDCGAELIRMPIPAEKAKIMQYCGMGDVITMTLGNRYNKFSGKRQFGIRVKCPNAGGWFSSHTDYVDENSLHDSDLPELTKL